MATTSSWIAYKSRKVTDTDIDHFVIAPESTAILRTRELDIDCCFFVAIIVFSPFAPDPFYLHSNKPLPELHRTAILIIIFGRSDN